MQTWRKTHIINPFSLDQVYPHDAPGGYPNPLLSCIWPPCSLSTLMTHWCLSGSCLDKASSKHWNKERNPSYVVYVTTSITTLNRNSTTPHLRLDKETELYFDTIYGPLQKRSNVLAECCCTLLFLHIRVGTMEAHWKYICTFVIKNRLNYYKIFSRKRPELLSFPWKDLAMI